MSKKHKCNRLSILRTLDITNISILRTNFHFPLFYSNENLINPFCITNLPYSELSLLQTIFFSREPKIPRYDELKALNTAESKEKNYFAS